MARQAVLEYQKRMTVQIPIRLNKNTDADILEWLSDLENRQGYIKDLIRADMMKSRR